MRGTGGKKMATSHRTPMPIGPKKRRKRLDWGLRLLRIARTIREYRKRGVTL